jgi:hypothetical protein
MKYDLQYVDTIFPTAYSTDFRLVNGLPNDFHYWGLLLDVCFPFTIAVAAGTALPLMSPFSVIERVLVEGNIQGLGKITLVDAPGRTLAAAAALTSTRFPHYKWSVDDPTLIAAKFARFLLPVPFCCSGRMNAAEDMVARTLLPGNAFANPISVTIRLGPGASIVTPAGATTNTIGAVAIDVHRVIVRLGVGVEPVGQKYIVQRALQGPFGLTANLVAGLIARLSVGSLYSRLLFQTGVEAVPPLFTVANETAITRLYLRQGPQKTIRDYLYGTSRIAHSWLEGYQPVYPHITIPAAAPAFTPLVTENVNGFPALVGTSLLDFCADGHLEESLNTLIWGAQGQALEVYGNVVGLANQTVEVYHETLTPR